MVRIIKLKGSMKKKQEEVKTEEPKLIMDVIEEDYPSRYAQLKEKFSQMGKMFTRDEWLSILTKSRASHEEYIRKDRKD